jgi:hypothetical protein
VFGANYDSFYHDYIKSIEKAGLSKSRIMELIFSFGMMEIGGIKVPIKIHNRGYGYNNDLSDIKMGNDVLCRKSIFIHSFY